jgi:hypothetical protein
MDNQPSRQVAPLKKERKTNLVALLFFLMGALHIYKEIQSLSHSNQALTTFVINPLLKVALLAVVVALMLELLV